MPPGPPAQARPQVEGTAGNTVDVPVDHANRPRLHHRGDPIPDLRADDRREHHDLPLLDSLCDLVQEGIDVRHGVPRAYPRPAEPDVTQHQAVQLAVLAEGCHELVEEDVHFFLVVPRCKPGRAELDVLDPFDQACGASVGRARGTSVRRARGDRAGHVRGNEVRNARGAKVQTTGPLAGHDPTISAALWDRNLARYDV